MFGLITFLLASLIPAPAFASVRTMADSGKPIYWQDATNLRFYGNPINASGLAEADVDTMLTNAFAAWSNSQVPATRARAFYEQSTTYAATSEYDSSNRVYFASRASRQMDPGVIALTEVLYYVNSGQIAEADMVFNDNDFNFSSDPTSTGTGAGGKTIYLQDVATHEAGHAFGIDHSTVNLASMFYTAFTGQANLNEDEKNIISVLYPAAPPTGRLTGNVRGSAGGVFGTQVSAINLGTGKIQAATLANPDGSFQLSNLPDASYAIMMEAFGVSPDTISTYYQNLNHEFCGSPVADVFPRKFYGACGSAYEARVVAINGGNAVALNTLAPSCNAMGAVAAPVAPAYLPGAGAIYGVISPGSSRTYRIQNASGAFRARALTYSLFSRGNVSVKFTTDSNGLFDTGTSTSVTGPRPDSNPKYDGYATATGNGADLYVRVSMALPRIPTDAFPNGGSTADDNTFFLLSLANDSANPGTFDYGAAAPVDMGACANLPNRLQSASFKSSAPKTTTTGGGCGSLGPVDSGGPGGGLTLLFGSALLIQAYLWSKRRLRLKLVRRRR